MIKWKLASRIDSELWKFQIFDSSDSKSLIRYQKILWICSLGHKNLLKFALRPIKFHNCHHASGQAGRMFATLLTAKIQPGYTREKICFWVSNWFVLSSSPACVSSGNHIRMLWTNAHSLVRALVSVGAVGAVGAAAPTDFEEDWVCTHSFFENLILCP